MKPYFVFVDGPTFGNADRVQEALSKLRKRIPEGCEFFLLRIQGGGAGMHANWWATGMGLPICHLPAKNDDVAGAIAELANVFKIDAAVLFRTKIDLDDRVERALDEEFVKTYIVE